MLVAVEQVGGVLVTVEQGEEALVEDATVAAEQVEDMMEEVLVVAE